MSTTTNTLSKYQHFYSSLLEFEPLSLVQTSAKRLLGWALRKVDVAQPASPAAHKVPSRYARHRSLGYQPVKGETYAIVKAAVQYDDIVMLDVISFESDRGRTSAFPVPTSVLFDGYTNKRFCFAAAGELVDRVIQITTGRRRRDEHGMLFSPVIKADVLK